MTVRIRLSRYGAKKRPFYRIVVADVRSPRDGRFIEKVGTYDPLKQKSDKSRISLQLDRIEHWIKSGAQPSSRVNQFLSDAGLTKIQKSNNPIKAKPKKKAQERLKAKEEQVKKKEEAKAAPAEEKPIETAEKKEEAKAAPAEEKPTETAEKKEEAKAATGEESEKK